MRRRRKERLRLANWVPDVVVTEDCELMPDSKCNLTSLLSPISFVSKREVLHPNGDTAM